MEKQQIIKVLKTMAKEGKKPSEMLRYLVLGLGEEQQLELMLLFTEAFDVSHKSNGMDGRPVGGKTIFL